MSGTPGLLVSVRSADEVEAALAGGAYLIDVKEPSEGRRSPRPRPKWSPPSSPRSRGKMPVSAALGEWSPNAITEAHWHLELKLNYVKWGLAGYSARAGLGRGPRSTPAANCPSAWRWSRWPMPIGSGPSRCRRLNSSASPSGSASRRSCSTPGARTARRCSTSSRPTRSAELVESLKRVEITVAIGGSLRPEHVKQLKARGARTTTRCDPRSARRQARRRHRRGPRQEVERGDRLNRLGHSNRSKGAKGARFYAFGTGTLAGQKLTITVANP